MAAHYGTAILPARPRRPHNKAKVEQAVLIVEGWPLGRLRHRNLSIAEIKPRPWASCRQLQPPSLAPRDRCPLGKLADAISGAVRSDTALPASPEAAASLARAVRVISTLELLATPGAPEKR
jgi:hypothetical protein